MPPALPTTAPLPAAQPRSLWRSRISGLAARVDMAWDAFFGAACLVIGLALLANIPVIQVASLGYLLEVSRRVGQTGRLRDSFVGVHKAARIGSVAGAAWLLGWIPKMTASLWSDALLIDVTGQAAWSLRIATAATSGWVVLHVAAAAYRGGRLRHFIWPRPFAFLRAATQPGSIAGALLAVLTFVQSLRLQHFFHLGFRGLAAGVAWLFVPASLLLVGAKSPIALALGLLGLAGAALVLPLLQTRLAVADRLDAAFAWRDALGDIRRAPLAVATALMGTLVLAAPLYLTKIELVPREAAWLPSVLFVVGAWPSRALCGWALFRSFAQEPTAWRTALAVMAGLLTIPTALAYAGLSYLTQFVSWYGPWSLYEQHAFLLPAPFLGLP